MAAVVLCTAKLASAQVPFEIVHAFAGETATGSSGYGALVHASDGNFYGTTFFGDNGRSDSGTIFRMTPAGIVTTMYTFPGAPGGAEPNGPLLQASDGNLYGTTFHGGPGYPAGTIFRMTLAGSVTIVHSIAYASEGYGTNGGLIQGTDGNLYGSNSYTIFRVTLAGAFTALHQLGYRDSSTLVQALDGNFYGTTHDGGALGYGTRAGSTAAHRDHSQKGRTATSTGRRLAAVPLRRGRSFA